VSTTVALWPIFDERLNAILSPPQLAAFCHRFRLDANDLQPATSGWGKVVLLSRDRAFVFPRDPRRVGMFHRELLVYDAMRGSPIPAPRLLERVTDKAISYYEFAVVTRPRGTIVSDVVHTSDDYLAVMAPLGKAIARWHAVDVEPFRALPRHRWVDRAKIEAKHIPWLLAATTPKLSSRAVAFAHALLLDVGSPPRALRASDVPARWSRAIAGIAAMDDTLVHSDVHEDQVFVDGSMKVTAVLDWEGARIDRPILDFDFGEWTVEFWRVCYDRLGEIRRTLWTSYLRARRMHVEHPDGFHLLFTLAELMSAVSQRERKVIGFSGKPFAGTVRDVGTRLAEITDTL
jgi:aminoglycoside phosphotransferase (APT) family kinase protein